MTRSSSSSSIGISIHALREEGDSLWLSSGKAQKHFYPRPPRGGRPALDHALAGAIQFLSTPSARRATIRPVDNKSTPNDFYPRPPRGGRPLALSLEPCDQLISIHALREEGDWMFYLFLVSL